jgi:rhodanese-related sulfurtransferase
MSVSAEQLVSEARLTVSEISPQTTRQRLEDHEIDVLLDVRETSEWNDGHIANALHTPRGLLEWHADPTHPSHQQQLAGQIAARIVVLCASGGRSLLAAKTLQEMGYTDVCSMNGGMTAWKANGLPVE